jgi:hypothetical protein
MSEPRLPLASRGAGCAPLDGMLSREEIMPDDDKNRKQRANELRSIVEHERDTPTDDAASEHEHQPRPGESPHAFEVRRSREIAREHQKHKDDD